MLSDLVSDTNKNLLEKTCIVQIKNRQWLQTGPLPFKTRHRIINTSKSWKNLTSNFEKEGWENHNQYLSKTAERNTDLTAI